jgi:hypothetical protein
VLAASIVKVMIALMVDSASTSEMSANFYQTTRRIHPENSHRHDRRRGNLNLTVSRMFALIFRPSE